MNIKADRIESIVQILNRNLLLICVGQISGITPVEHRSLRRIDTSVFASDKFAFEMVEFAKSYRKPPVMDMPADWERHFVRGLELLLAECAVVKDEVERDCFVSRIYAWFMEKLAERRDIDKDKDAIAARRRAAEKVQEQDGDDGEDLMKEKFPPVNAGGHSEAKMYSKHVNPKVAGTRPAGESNAISDNMGMLFLQEPQTEAEIEMHNLWLAKRQQEAFDLKARHQLAVVMDRRSLHKSRLESEALRRLESSTFLAASFDAHSPGKKQTCTARPLSAGNSRYAPMVKRPMSGKRQYMSALDNGYEEMREQKRQSSKKDAGNAIDHFPPPDFELPAIDAVLSVVEEGAGSLVSPPATDTTVRVKTQEGNEERHHVAKSGRNIVEKSKSEFKPMKFKSSIPDGFVARQKKVKQVALDNYLQDFDSDEEKDAASPSAPPLTRQASKKMSIQASTSMAATPGEKTLKRSKSMPAGSGINAILSKQDPIRDRPVSAQKFREISATDSEMKVLYRYSNFRRMPLTEEQELWLNNRENQRIADTKEKLKKIAQENAARTQKEEKKKDKKPEGRTKKKAAPEPPPPPKIVKKYSSATQFMETHFPKFDTDDNVHAIGPMRAEQLAECEDILQCFALMNIQISEKTIRNALIVPQDRPEAICLEGTKNPIEGLMTNPLPKEYWRKLVAAVKKKKKNGGGKKKKK